MLGKVPKAIRRGVGDAKTNHAPLVTKLGNDAGPARLLGPARFMVFANNLDGLVSFFGVLEIKLGVKIASHLSAPLLKG